MRHNKEEIEWNIELNCENEVSCLIATSKYILIGISEPNPRLLIYDLQPVAQGPKKAIDLSKTPTELAIYKDNLCICIQANSSGSDVR